MTDLDVYMCKTCGQSHAGLPFSFAASYPDMIANITPGERDIRAVVASDQCVLDSKWFFVRGLVEIPIIGKSEPFLWGLWAAVLEHVYDEMSDCWELKGRENSRGPYKGRLANALSDYPGTLNLKLSIALQAVGCRPLFTIEDADHPLGRQQRVGITQREANEIATLLLHGEGRGLGHS